MTLPEEIIAKAREQIVSAAIAFNVATTYVYRAVDAIIQFEEGIVRLQLYTAMVDPQEASRQLREFAESIQALKTCVDRISDASRAVCPVKCLVFTNDAKPRRVSNDIEQKPSTYG